MGALADRKSSIHNKVRIIVGVDVLLLSGLIGAYSLNAIYETLKAANLEDAVSFAVFLLLFGSTLSAIVLWVGEVVRKWRQVAAGRSGTAIALDGVMLLVWSLVLGGICVYAFVVGMAG